MYLPMGWNIGHLREKVTIVLWTLNDLPVKKQWIGFITYVFYDRAHRQIKGAYFKRKLGSIVGHI